MVMIQPGMVKLEKDNNEMMIDEGKIFTFYILIILMYLMINIFLNFVL